MELKQGYKQTELGIIPNDWEVNMLGDIIKLKNGFAFSSNYYTDKGDLIIITPGNFKIEGGLSFTVKNTLRYNGFWKNGQAFEIGDLLIVMTDLTPDCNLLGKSGIVKDKEIILHNQRIGKIIPIKRTVYKEYLMYYFNSEHFSNRMKNTATGSTVRHTSVPTINKTILPVPPLPEQTAIATALSNIDELISQTEKLIDKKKAIKQGVMQELLKPKEGWVTKKLGQLLEYEQPTKYIVDSDKYSDNNPIPVLTAGKSFILGYTSEDYNVFENFPVIIFDDFTTSTQFVDFRFKVKSSAMKILKPKSTSVNLKFMFEILNNIHFPVADHKRHWIGEFQNIDLFVPTEDEMNKIGNIIEEFQDEIQLIQSKLQKLKLQKQGMMQALLTGKIRLI